MGTVLVQNWTRNKSGSRNLSAPKPIQKWFNLCCWSRSTIPFSCVKMRFSGLGTVAHACNPSTLGGWGRWITRSGDQDHPGQDGETPSLLKTIKISQAQWQAPSYSGGWGRKITWTWVAEVAVSRDCAVRICQKKKKSLYIFIPKHCCCLAREELIQLAFSCLVSIQGLT